MEKLEVFEEATGVRKDRELLRLYKVQLPDGSFLSGATSEFTDKIHRYTRGEALKKAIRFDGKLKFDGDYKLVLVETQEFHFSTPDDLSKTPKNEIETAVTNLYGV